MQKNIFGLEITPCSNNPKTGYFRDGCCNTDEKDFGVHTVCVLVTEEFLAFSKNAGNDLSTPVTIYNFSGLKPGDKWCLCASRWLEAHHAGQAPLIDLEATNEETLKYIPMNLLLEYAIKVEQNS